MEARNMIFSAIEFYSFGIVIEPGSGFPFNRNLVFQNDLIGVQSISSSMGRSISLAWYPFFVWNMILFDINRAYISYPIRRFFFLNHFKLFSLTFSLNILCFSCYNVEVDFPVPMSLVEHSEMAIVLVALKYDDRPFWMATSNQFLISPKPYKVMNISMNFTNSIVMSPDKKCCGNFKF